MFLYFGVVYLKAQVWTDIETIIKLYLTNRNESKSDISNLIADLSKKFIKENSISRTTRKLDEIN